MVSSRQLLHLLWLYRLCSVSVLCDIPYSGLEPCRDPNIRRRTRRSNSVVKAKLELSFWRLTFPQRLSELFGYPDQCNAGAVESSPRDIHRQSMNSGDICSHALKLCMDVSCSDPDGIPCQICRSSQREHKRWPWRALNS